MAPYPGPAFGIAGSVVAGGELYVFAGSTWDATTKAIANFAESYAYSPAKDAWRELKPYPRAIRGVVAVALNERWIYLAGGYGSDGFTDEAFLYDMGTGTYRAALRLPYRSGPHLVQCGVYVYCFGGEDQMKHRSSETYRIKVAELTATKG